MLNLRKHVYEVDENGFFVEMYLANVDEEGNILDEDKQGFVTVDYPSGLVKRKWNGIEWIEGATQEEIDEMTKVESLPPTDTEILGQQMTEREIEAMIQGQQLSDIEIRLLTLEVK